MRVMHFALGGNDQQTQQQAPRVNTNEGCHTSCYGYQRLQSQYVIFYVLSDVRTTANDDVESPEESLICGDGIVGADEACDGGGEATADCDADCTEVVCGDGVVNSAAGETCDDGNTEVEACDYGESSCVVCGSACTEVAGEVLYCGNGTVEGDEACDEAGDTSAPADCTEADCGDGYLNTSITKPAMTVIGH